MTAGEFIAWAMKQPDGERYELADGEVIAMAPEPTAHARAKRHIFWRMRLSGELRPARHSSTGL
jgi:Uma2 family endonuclease